jgi:hypothetical protein
VCLGVGIGGASWGVGEVLPRVAVLWVVSVVGVWSREGLVSHKGRLVLLALLEDVHSPQTNQKEEQLNARVDETDNHGVLKDSILVDAIDDEEEDSQGQEEGEIGCESAEETASALARRQIPPPEHPQQHKDEHFFQKIFIYEF